jgi:peptide/nickel transport system permease protein
MSGVERIETPTPPTRSLLSVPHRRPRRRRPILVIVCVSWLILVIVLAMIADLLPLTDPIIDADHGVRTPPFTRWDDPFGTDGLGRSVLSRLIFGARISLFAGFAGASIALAIGLVLGLLSGYLRGPVETGIGILVDSILAIPGLVLLLAIGAVLGARIETVIIGLSIIGSAWFARLARSSTLRIASAEYIAAARGLGSRTSTILLREILPGVAYSVAPYAGVIIGNLILAEAALSFLGLGVAAPTPSWGNMISDGALFLRQAPALALVPGAVLFFTIFSVNTFGDWLRQRSDASSKL